MSFVHMSVILTGSALFSGRDAVTLLLTKTFVHNAFIEVYVVKMSSLTIG
jgi:hypothetical protein